MSYVSVGWAVLADTHDEGTEYSKMGYKIMRDVITVDGF
jgi:hypothetical protein